MSMWEPFTERARRVIVLAFEEARPRQPHIVETGDLLLGLIAEGENVAARVLATQDMDLATARDMVRAPADPTRPAILTVDPPTPIFSASAKRCIEQAFVEARHLQHSYIGCEHLLLGIISVNEQDRSDVVARICGDGAVLREKIKSLIPEEAATTGHPSATTARPASTAAMWEPFTEAARQTIVLAEEAAQERGNHFIGNEHIFMGMLASKNGPGYEALTHAQVTEERLRAAVEATCGSGRGSSAPGEMVFTPTAKRTIEHAFAAARMLNHTFIDSGHLLVGLTEDSDVAAKILDALAIDRELLKRDTIARLQQI